MEQQHIEGTNLTATPSRVYRGKYNGVNVTCKVYGKLSEQAIKNFNRVFNDAMDEIEKRKHRASA